MKKTFKATTFVLETDQRDFVNTKTCADIFNECKFDLDAAMSGKGDLTIEQTILYYIQWAYSQGFQNAKYAAFRFCDDMTAE